jgi:hypothetical protein
MDSMFSEQLPQAVKFSLWTGVAASATAWGLALWPHGPVLPTSVPVVAVSGFLPTPSVPHIAKVLAGGTGPANGDAAVAGPSLASRLLLSGVAKAGSAQSLALISVDGQAAQTFYPGQEVLPGWVLQSVSADQALLGHSTHPPALLTLSLPTTDAGSEHQAMK